MIKVSSDADRVLVAKVREAAQEHVLQFWEQLSQAEQAVLLGQLHSLNLLLVKDLVACYLKGTQEVMEDRLLTAAPLLRVAKSEEEIAREKEVRAAGEEALRKGQVAILTAAGDTGEGSIPKGLFAVGPVSQKTLFCLHAERVRAISKKYRASLPWIVATSHGTHEATVAHFKQSEYFGLNRGDVIFLVQDELPVVNRRGKILLAERGRLAMSPNGHGGVLLKLLGDDALFQSLELRGIEHLFYFQVDNAMARIVDPVFLGYHLQRGCEASSKTVCKVDPEEKVGIFCQFNGSLGVVEYRELSPEDKIRKDSGGSLELSAGNIGIHAFSMDFLRRLRQERVALPYHFVEGKIPHLDRKGNRVVPRTSNGIQFKCFIFDALPLGRTTLVLETERQDEFSPVKGLNGANSVATARRDLSKMYARWLQAAGANVRGGSAADPGPFEISPLYALDSEELKAKLETPLDAEAGLYLK